MGTSTQTASIIFDRSSRTDPAAESDEGRLPVDGFQDQPPSQSAGRPYTGRVNRRLLGLVVLVVAVVAAVAGTARVKIVPGSPMAAAFDGAPAVGDCLLVPVPAAPPGPDAVYPDLATGPCSGRRYGEVVGVVPGRAPSTVTGATDAPLGVPYATVCTDAALNYLGQDRAGDGGPAPIADLWYPVPLGRSVYFAAITDPWKGPAWVACVLVPPQSAGRTADYPGSARGGARGGALPGAFSVCSGSEGDAEGDADCAAPHLAEILGYTGALASPPTLADLTVGCQELTTRLTGLTDPTAAGRLAVVLAPHAGGGDEMGRDTVIYRCELTAAAGRELTGPLLGVGDGPVPVR